jgi:hypothetical protein
MENDYRRKDRATSRHLRKEGTGILDRLLRTNNLKEGAK